MTSHLLKQSIVAFSIVAAGGVGFVLGTLHGPAAGQGAATEPLPYTYSDPGFGFSFRYPEGFYVQGPFVDEMDEQRRIWLVQPGMGAGGMEILVSYRDGLEGRALTAEFLREEHPDLLIQDLRQLKVDALDAVSFASSFEDIGPVSVLVFHTDYALYQLTAPLAFKDRLLEMAGTWRFLHYQL